jgi:hypothetical protein
MEKLSSKEKAALVKATAMRQSEVNLWQKLEARVKPLERALKSPKLGKASQVYQACMAAPGEEILFLYMRTPLRLVQDRIRNFLQKYFPAAQEITDKQVAAAGAVPGTPKFKKLKEEMITTRLDARVRKQAPTAPEEEPALAAGRPRGGPPTRSDSHGPTAPQNVSAQRRLRASGARRH